ncbi:MAG TPA: type II secretion system F family protein [Nocardioidaceae bacterium]|nr:type II secretion system F family protein [Nocardioidaceae bacterium]
MTGVAAVLALLAAWAWASPDSAVRRRLGVLIGAAGSVEASASDGGTGWVERPIVRGAACGLSGAAAGQAVHGVAFAILGAVAGVVASWLIGRLEPPSARRRRAEIERDLPLAVELLAACAMTGLAIETSLDVVASAVGGSLHEILAGHTARLRLGADPVDEWRRLQRLPPVEALARSMVRSAESGAAVVELLDRLADDLRKARAASLQRRARSVGVRAAGPLGLCFLPAFMLVAVVPTVVGGFAHVVG